ncbi:MAG TPA: M67 family peptidase [Nitrospinaceae bacterium]|jgi:proteasome lid subunit RPN8/RPN11|nr:M67 family peptidase [Nitrospinaceae bacterium]
MFPLTEEQLDEIHRHAVGEYPFECCGIVIGKVGYNDQDIIFRCTNIQNKLHEKDPKTFVRDARTAYNIDPKELMKILKEVESKQLPIKVFYHSHPEHDAYFSEEDSRMALFDGEPTYPEASYLVVSIYDKKIRDQALFAWSPEAKTFERAPS